MNQAEKRAFYKELTALAIPLGLQNLLIALIGATDALMLGRLSQEAVAAVSLANQISFVMNLFIGAVVGGGSALIALLAYFSGIGAVPFLSTPLAYRWCFSCWHFGCRKA